MHCDENLDPQIHLVSDPDYSALESYINFDVVSTDEGTQTADDSMTVKNCLMICNALNRPVFGIEYSRECWCKLSPSSGHELGYSFH